MQRLTARLLLLFAIAGSFIPLTMQALAAPAHACCRRKATHQCHGSAELEGRVVRNKSCCQQNCSRGVTTSQAAWPNMQATAFFTQCAEFHATHFSAAFPACRLVTSRSPRGPPQLSIA
jgi:hypothetical protein